MQIARIIFLLFLISCPVIAESDSGCNPELIKELKQPYPDCNTINLNALKAVRSYYEAGEIDSVRVLMEQWRHLCYIGYPEIYLSYLINIILGNFRNTDIDSSFFYNAMYYEQPVRQKERIVFHTADRTDITFDGFVSYLADTIAAATDSTSTEHLIALLVGKKFDRFYYLLRHERAFDDSPIKKAYETTINDIQRPELIDLIELFMVPPYPSFNGIIGYWMPVGNLHVAGFHPEIGFGLGRRLWRFHGDLFMTFRFLNPQHNLLVAANNTVYASNQFWGFQVGVDLGYTLFKKRRWQLDALVDGGIEFMNVLESDESAGIPGKTLSSYFGGPGIGSRFFIGRRRKFVINPQAWYSFLDYEDSNRGGDKLSGGAFSFRIVFHNSLYHEDEELKRLRYFE